ncbi:hypothetical protein [Sphingomonas oryzagri]
MRSNYRVMGVILGVSAVALGAAPVLAQLPWSWASDGFDRSEYDVLHPLIQAMLRNSPVGEVQSWHSPSGRTGKVYLVSGGDQAHSTEAVVRITIIGHDRRENPLFTFRYRKDAKEGWRTVG